MNTLQFLLKLKELKIEISLSDGRLKINAPEGILTSQLKNEISSRKEAIVDFLISAQKKYAFSEINVVEERSHYGLSSAQRRLWILSQFEEGNVAYNIPSFYTFHGSLDRAAFDRTFRTLVERHESLRTTFIIVEGDPKQKIHSYEELGFSVEYIDLRGDSDAGSKVSQLVKSEGVKAFDLECGPLLRAGLIQLGDEDYVFMFTLHHIISDGWSMEVLVREVLHLYACYSRGEAHSLRPLRIQYKDYASWQNQQLTGDGLKDHRGYWHNRLSGELPVLDFPSDYARPSVKTYAGSSVGVVLDEALSKKLKALSQRHGASLFMTLLAGVKALLYRYTGQEDIIVGVPIAGRDHADLEDQIGFYINNLALRTRFSKKDSFESLLAKVKESCLGGYAHQLYPFDKLVDELPLTRDMSRSPLFDVGFTWNEEFEKPSSYNEIGEGDLSIGTYSSGRAIARWDLSIHGNERDRGILLTVVYNTDLYTSGRIERMLGHLQILFESIVEDSSVRVNSINYLPGGERQHLLKDFNNTARAYPQEKTLQALFEEQVDRTPDAIALKYGEKELTYKQLDAQSNALAHYLRSRYAIEPDDLIGLMVERSERMVIGILGILKSGAGYVPIDPSYPRDRKGYMLSDANPKVLITESEYIFEISEYYGGSLLGIDIQLNDLEHWYGRVEKINSSRDLAYVIYTSGSTGRPKGVMIEHRSVVNYLLNSKTEYVSSENTTSGTFVYLPMTFDASITGLFMPLIRGKFIVLGSQDLINVFEDSTFIKNVPYDFLKLTPSHLSMLRFTMDSTGLDQVSNKIVIGGEALRKQDIGYLKDKGIEVELINEYGPTEATVGSSVYRFKSKEISDIGGSISIGSSIDNVELYILDEVQELCGIGISGEICIGGAGLARGYLNREELTQEKFISNPYKAGERLYRTGDIGRWLADGHIEFLGRRDDQVKVRGYRIELGEVEHSIATYADVEKAVVVSREDATGNKQLIGYYTRPEAVESEKLKEYLRSILPDYMVPTYLIRLEQFPLTSNGKIDKKSLPSPEELLLGITTAYVGPRNETEAKLLAIWEQVLGRDRIGVHDNFFEVGGHSLKATQVMSRIHKEFEVKVEFKTIFSHPTVSGLSEQIRQSSPIVYESITGVEEQEYYGLSSAQRRLWILSQFEGGNVAYNIPGVYSFQGDLHREAFEKTFRTLVDRHESLRTTFVLVEGDPKQKIHSYEELGFSVEYIDLRGDSDAGLKVSQLVQSEGVKAFDLERGPLLRAGLIQLGDEDYVFMFTLHHIISDGWSMEVLVREVLHLYACYSRGEAHSLAPLRIQYKDYASWQNQQLTGDGLKDHRGYWHNQLSDELPVLDFPSDYARPSVKTYAGSSVGVVLDEALSKKLKALSQRHGASLFMTLLAGVKALLYRYTGQEDIIVGVPIAGRDHADLEDQIGFYINNLALRTRFSKKDSFESLLAKVKESCLGGYAHQLYPFDKLVDELPLTRDMSRSPLFDVGFTWNEEFEKPSSYNEIGEGDLSIGTYSSGRAIARWDLSIHGNERDRGILLTVVYNTDLYTSGRIERMLGHLQILFESIVEDSSVRVNSINYLPGGERQHLLKDFNNTARAYPQEKTLQALFEEQVDRTPDAIALKYGEKELTYKQLDAQSNALAHYLRSRYAIEPDDLIGLMVERSERMVIGILGILKSGAGYVPIDPSYPRDRKGYMLSDANPKVLITESEYIFEISEYYGGSLLGIDIQLNDLEHWYGRVEKINSSRDLAYVIYTSGSTGRPKGVMIEHRSVVNYLLNSKTEYVSSENTTSGTFVYLPMTFDASITGLFMPLIRGKFIVLGSQDLINVFEDSTFIKNVPYDFLKLTPSHLSMLRFTMDSTGLDQVSNKIVIGGEALRKQDIAYLKDKGIEVELINEYGPTEATVGSSVYRFKSKEISDIGGSISIGSSIDNVELYILDEVQELCGIGISGEICIGGAGLARGYLNREELTQEKFISNPYKAGERLYRTGDIGRWLADGNIEFLGRRDDQVKVRGYRIELGEVEHSIATYEDVEKAVVVSREDATGNKQLIGYYARPEAVESEKLKEYLRSVLPDYMVPTYLVHLERIPLTPNGKIDKKALPSPEKLLLGITTAYVGPRNETEAKLLAIWEQVLGRDRIGVHDNFFEVGGHSLKATQVMSRIHKEFEVKVEFKTIFSHPTVSGLSEQIRQSSPIVYESITGVEEQEYYALSSAQRRLWILSQFEGGNVAYNIPGVYSFQGDLHREAFEKTFRTLVERHESLRTTFVLVEGDPKQKIHSYEELGFVVEYIDLRGDSDAGSKVSELVKSEGVKAFDLECGPLLRAGLIQLGDEDYVFMFTLHHIISDGWSMEVLVREVLHLYACYSRGEAHSLRPLRIQYKDYASWQNQQLTGDGLKDHRGYWHNQLSGELPVLDFPSDYARPSVKTYAGSSVGMVLDEALSKKLKALSQRHGASLFMTLLAGVKALLYRYTGQEDIIVGVPIAGRDHADLEDQIGFYINNLALRTRFSKKDSFESLLAKVKESCLGGYAHQLYPFDKLVEDLDVVRDMSRSPVFDCGFTWHAQAIHREDVGLETSDLTIEAYSVETKVAKTDFWIHGWENGQVILLSVEYNTDLYKVERMEGMLRHLITLLQSATSNSSSSISVLEYLPSEEQEQLLDTFNSMATAYPQDKTIPDLFESQVERSGSSIAIRYADKELSYEELNAESNRLAHYLRDRYAIKPDDLIGLMVDRSERMVIGILGILKSGAGYVPIDPSYPRDRKRHMLSDVNPKVLITESEYIFEVSDYYGGDVFGIDIQLGGLQQPVSNPEKINGSADLAYVNYTSGSTGKPKGVMVEHRSNVNMSLDQIRQFGITSKDNVLQFASISFDASVSEIFMALYSGASLTLISKTDIEDGLRFIEYVREKGVNVVTLPPTYLNSLDKSALSFLSTIITAGEGPIVEDAIYCRRFSKYYNAYGPTEYSVCASIYALEEGVEDLKKIPIGKPISNTQMYVLDSDLNLVPVGVNGEICISGAGLARGYLNREELTQEKFVSNPYKAGERLYRTGDTGRWLPDGNIEFLGRRDDQVKVRGYRIELGEVEHTIATYIGIKKAVMVARENNTGGKQLVGYYTSSGAVESEKLKEYLRSVLPDYMVPTYLIALEQFPLTSNGKIDKKSLPSPEALLAGAREYVSPRNETEEKLLAIWEQVLGRSGIGVHDNFFEVGGDSLKATQVMSRIYKEFEVKIEFKTIFSHPAVSGLSEQIRQASPIIYESIIPIGDQSHYELSSAQRRLWILSQFEGGNVAYNMPGLYSLRGTLHCEAFEKTFKTLLERHESLRTTFILVEGDPKQKIHSYEELGFAIDYIDLRGESDQGSKVSALSKSASLKPFDLERGPLLRAGLIQLSEQEYVFLFTLHHIISDGWSMEVLVREVFHLYDCYSRGEDHSLAPLRSQYKDYAAWQNKQLTGEGLKDQQGYWHNQLSGELPVLDFPSDYARPSVKTYNGGSVGVVLDEELSKKLKALSQRHGASLFMTLLAGVKALLYRYTGQEDIIVGSPIAGRDHHDLEDQIGFYVNTLALRTRIDKEDSFEAFLEKVKETCLEGYSHQLYPFDELVEELKVVRDMSRSAVFDVMVLLQNTGTTEMEKDLSGIVVNAYGLGSVISKFDLSFGFAEAGDRIALSIDYNTDLYQEWRIVSLSRYLKNLFTSIVLNPQERVSVLSYLEAAEEELLLVGFNETESSYPHEKTIQELFEEQVARIPDNIAVVYEDKELTYDELNKISNQLAHYLRSEYGVKADDLVGFMVDRSERMLVGILGILKSGGAYVPIDPSYPAERKQYMLEDSRVKVLLVEEEELGLVVPEGCEILNIQSAWDKISKKSTRNLKKINTSSDLAYVIYTSGSTGQPKGVMVQHVNVVSLFKHQSFEFNFNDKDVWSVFHSYSFDFSVWEIFGALLFGGKAVMVPWKVCLDIGLFTSLLNTCRVTVVNQTPSFFAEVLSFSKQADKLFKDVRYLILGGEALKPRMLKEARHPFPKARFINMYGITETTVHVTYKEIREEDIEQGISNIGRPISSLQVVIVDNSLNLVPIGVNGEMLIRGGGVSRGYLDRQKLTQERFIWGVGKDLRNRYYRSGDLGRLLPNGEIEYLGRKDNQVKVRGYRIELGEVEHHISMYAGVVKSVVIARDDTNDSKQLVGYFTSGRILEANELKSYLRSVVPEYMVPSYLIQLERFPLTSNGKVDKKSLPLPEELLKGTAREYVSARNETEAKLLAIWEQVLGRDRIGVHDNFFEVGGHSLKVTQVMSRIHKEFEVKVEFKTIFSHPTVSGLSEQIRQASLIVYESITAVEEQEYYALSSAQRRLWILSQFEGGNVAYNIPGVYSFQGLLHREAFEKTFKALLERHESLRTTFIVVEGAPKQKIHSYEELGFSVEYIDLRGDSNAGSKVSELVKSEAVKAFDLERGPLLRAGLIQLGDEDYVFMFTLHHIISDGWSMEVLVREVLHLYDCYRRGEAHSLRPLRIQYKDYASWQNQQLTGDGLKDHRGYWHNQLSGELPVLDFPSDYVRPLVKTYSGSSVSVVLDEVLSKKLKALSQRHGASLFMTLLAGVKSLLYRYTGQEDIIVGSPIAGREHNDLEDQIGFYVNTLALRTRIDKEDSFESFLEKVKETCFGGYAHQLYPFDKLVEELNVVRDMSRSPVFDCGFTWHAQAIHQEDVGLETSDLTIEAYSVETKVAKTDFWIHGWENGQVILLSVEYNTDLYKVERMEGMLRHLITLLESATSNSSSSISVLEYLPSKEQEQLLDTFNSTATAYPQDKTIPDLFESQVERSGSSIAIRYADKELSYEELNAESNRLAHYLRDRYAIKPDDLIGIMVDRSERMVIGILGILKSGAGYVPIDPSYPRDRKRYMLSDVNPKVLITESEYIFEVSDYYGGDVFGIDIQLNGLQQPVSNPEKINGSADLAYVIYTSGSTGSPKGVMVEHRSNVNMSLDQIRQFGITSKDNVLQFASISFDASVYEIFIALYSGATLTLISKADIEDGSRFIEYVREKGVNVATLPPTYLNSLDKSALSFLSVIITAGEGPIVEDAIYYSKFSRYYNAYGPTEYSVCASIYALEEGVEDIKKMPIGKPISNTQIYVLDSDLNLVPVGVNGEICISGAGLARGYLNREELTQEKFISNPYKPGERLYRTGDIGRWLPDGNIEFLGRRDDQVKIRGYRIELGEVEHNIAAYVGVEKAVIVAREDATGSKQLVGYYTHSGAVESEKLKEYLRSVLPEYMVPTYLIALEQLPLTSNGKIDKKSLPSPEELSVGARSYVAPQTEMESKLVEIWEQVLGRDKISINDNFFEVGGDSIKAIQISSRVYKLKYKLEIRDIFQYPTIAQLSEKLKPLDRVSEQGVVIGGVPLTAIQRWFFENVLEDKHHYNQSVMFYKGEGFDAGLLQAIFGKLEEHHDALRMVYRLSGDKIEQENRGVGAGNRVQIEKYDLSGLPLSESKSALAELATQLQQRIDLTEGPLLKVGLFKLIDGDRLLIVIHHLVVDGVSWRILFEDLGTLYSQYQTGAGFSLPLKSDSFQRWSEQVRLYSNSELLERERDYWESIASVSVPSLGVDHVIEKSLQTDSASCSLSLSSEYTELLLTQVHQAYGTEINDILLTGLGISINGIFGVDRVKIDLEGHGRENIGSSMDVSRTVGWFTSIYPIVLDMDYKSDISGQLKAVKDHLHRVPNKGIGYGILKYISAVGIEGEGSPSAISFNYLGQFDTEVGTSSFEIANEWSGEQVSRKGGRKYLLDVSGMISEGRLQITISYNRNQYDRSTIERLCKSYEESLKYIIEHCRARRERVYTPSDYYYKGLSLARYEELCESGAIENIYHLSPMQSGLLFHYLMDRTSSNYFEQMSYRLHGEIEPELVERSLEELFIRHGVLRTMIVHEGVEKPLQVVLQDRRIEFYYADLMDRVSEDREIYVKEYKARDKARGFDLQGDVLMRVGLLRVGEQEYEFVWSHHHILMDGWCMGILINEFTEIYSSYKTGRRYALPEVAPYNRYLEWLDRHSQGGSRSYWQKYLLGYEEVSSLPRDLPLSKGEYKVNERQVSLSIEQTKSLLDLATRCQVTVNTIIQSVWAIVLGKYSGKRDVVYGAVVSGRPSGIAGVERMVGLFINTIPVRISYSESDKLSDLIKSVQARYLEGEPYHYSSLAEIQSLSELGGNLLDHILVFENYPVAERIEGYVAEESEASWGVSQVEVFEQTNYDFNIMAGMGARLDLRFSYNGRVYSDRFIDQVSGHVLRVLEQLLASEGEVKVEDLELLTDGEREQLLKSFNATDSAYPQEKPIQELFEDQVERTPSNIAVVYADKELTYEELNKASNQLANYLRSEYGIKADDLVGIMVDRSERMLVGILGILKSGGAYVPIDPSYPIDRKQYMLEDSRVKVLLVEDDVEGLVVPEGCKILNIQSSWDKISKKSRRNPKKVNSSNDLAYVIYTSGSTGRPKGVMVEHTSVINLSEWLSGTIYRPEARPLVSGLTASINFDASVQQLFSPLFNGSSLVILSESKKRDPRGYIQELDRHKVEVLDITPAYLEVLLNAMREMNEPVGFKHILVGGEALSKRVVKHFNSLYSSGTGLINVYGITECTVNSTYEQVDDNRSALSIGKCLPNTSVYILDETLQLVPLGVCGEICIGGAGLARGYLNRAELTQEKFIANPYKPGERLYCTGDIGRWLPDGNIEFLGRRDDQVKVRGYRIELGEVEHNIIAYTSIEKTVVVAREDNTGGKQLVGYYTSSEVVESEKLKEYLRSVLPDYMVPSYLIQLEQFPLTSNGKIDKKLLTSHKELLKGFKEYIAPRNAIEEKLSEIWQQILGIEEISIHDNFFAIGGDSIKAMQIASKVYKIKYKLEIKDIFEYPTIAQLVDKLKPVDQLPYQGMVTGEAPLTPIQHWFFNSNVDDVNRFNHAMMFRRKKGFDIIALQTIFDKILHHHDALRMIFKATDTSLVQVNRPVEELKSVHIETYDLSDLPLSKAVQNLEYYTDKIGRSLSIYHGPLMKVALFKLSDGERLLILIHHLIVDGVSWRILFEDIGELYRQYQLGEILSLLPKTDSYLMWSNRLRQYGTEESFMKECAYWKSIEQIKTPDFPTDFKISKRLQSSMTRHSFALSQDRTELLLISANQTYNAKVKDLMLVALALAMKETLGIDALKISLNEHGRTSLQDLNLNRTVGWFTCVYPIVLDLKNNNNLSTQILAVKQLLAEVPNQGIGYGIFRYLYNSKDNVQIPPAISFNYLGQFDSDMEAIGFEMSSESVGQQISDFQVEYALEVEAIVVNKRLEIDINYSKSEFKDATIHSIKENYHDKLVQIIDHCNEIAAKCIAT